MIRLSIIRVSAFLITAAALATGPASRGSVARQAAPPQAKPQPRPHTSRMAVDPRLVHVDDGDTVVIRWRQDRDEETVRLLGIDCPETRHIEHDIPYDQAFGHEARAFMEGVIAVAKRIELARAATLDPYDRTLGYVFVDGRNTSVLVIAARLAYESITQFGDNGFPTEAAEVKAAAAKAGPLPFEPPYQFRARMRDVAQWMKRQGVYPIR
jgi:micrococcal nuclease